MSKNSPMDIPTIRCPKDKREIEMTDPTVNLLKHVITRSGKRRFLIRYVYQGKKRAYAIGDHTTMTIKEAQIMGIEAKSLLAKGIDPQDAYKLKSIPTFATFARGPYLSDSKGRKRSYPDEKARLEQHLIPELGKYLLSEITTGMLTEVLNKVKAKGLANASVNRIRALLSSLFQMAIDHDYIDINPVSRVKKLKENNQIERYLSEQELPRLLDVLNAPHAYGIDNLTIVALVKFLLITGVRKREAMDVKWTDINLDTGVWLLTHNKSGKARHINLNHEALNIIKAMLRCSEYVFANPKTLLPFNDMRKTFDKIMDSANISNIRIHDLRHNFASAAVNSGQSLFIVQHLLGHASPQTTQRYAHLQSSTLKQASEQVASVILQAQVA
ncbi:tyrosine-type recombinase/integrase [Acinetobacter calcoaceticus]|uniref:tyrosine-type recombinase/integrase n=1 Tax=Acinetobacter calcoaceticus TaxID=471 RepID=UPI002860CED5|nr:tyrosine-type recombinase/integrase [Acinetobacter calcoaceticus]MDR6796843.1 site-specific recombinase XerD [Acinetobacter calcoaceticus]